MARKLLSPKYTRLCNRCKHAKAAHKGACKMKHCKCPEYSSGFFD